MHCRLKSRFKKKYIYTYIVHQTQVHTHLLLQTLLSGHALALIHKHVRLHMYVHVSFISEDNGQCSSLVHDCYSKSSCVAAFI